MTLDEFNQKWKLQLEEKAIGLDINDNKAIEYLDYEFEKEVKKNPNFKFTKIKLKFNRVVIYTNSDNKTKWVNELTALLNLPPEI